MLIGIVLQGTLICPQIYQSPVLNFVTSSVANLRPRTFSVLLHFGAALASDDARAAKSISTLDRYSRF